MHSDKIKVWIFDFDGTLSNPEHRRHFVRQKPKNWPAFTRGCKDDTPNRSVVALFEKLYSSFDEVFIFSARPEVAREDSVRWLLTNCPSIKNSRYNDLSSRLFLRADRDYRGDELVKPEMLGALSARLDRELGEDEWEIMGIFDDRPKVVKQWQTQGIWTFDVGQGCENF